MLVPRGSTTLQMGVALLVPRVLEEDMKKAPVRRSVLLALRANISSRRGLAMLGTASIARLESIPQSVALAMSHIALIALQVAMRSMG